jgi:hypothetical protein
LVANLVFKFLRPVLDNSVSNFGILLKILDVFLMVEGGHFSVGVYVAHTDVMNDLVSDFSFEFFPNSFVSGQGRFRPLRLIVGAVSAGQI